MDRCRAAPISDHLLDALFRCNRVPKAVGGKLDPQGVRTRTSCKRHEILMRIPECGAEKTHLGHYIRSSGVPNCVDVIVDGTAALITLRELKIGDELTVGILYEDEERRCTQQMARVLRAVYPPIKSKQKDGLVLVTYTDRKNQDRYLNVWWTKKPAKGALAVAWERTLQAGTMTVDDFFDLNQGPVERWLCEKNVPRVQPVKDKNKYNPIVAMTWPWKPTSTDSGFDQAVATACHKYINHDTVLCGSDSVSKLCCCKATEKDRLKFSFQAARRSGSTPESSPDEESDKENLPPSPDYLVDVAASPASEATVAYTESKIKNREDTWTAEKEQKKRDGQDKESKTEPVKFYPIPPGTFPGDGNVLIPNPDKEWGERSKALALKIEKEAKFPSPVRSRSRSRSPSLEIKHDRRRSRSPGKLVQEWIERSTELILKVEELRKDRLQVEQRQENVNKGFAALMGQVVGKFETEISKLRTENELLKKRMDQVPILDDLFP